MNERELHEDAPGGDGVTIRATGALGGIQIEEHLMASHPCQAPDSPALCAVRKLQAGHHGLIVGKNQDRARAMMSELLAACPPGFQPIKRRGDAAQFPSGAVVAAVGERCSYVGAVADWLWLESESMQRGARFDRELRPVIVHSREAQPVIVGAA